ncbi:MAG: dTMP kinase [Anaerolineales bacterium]|nr:dTMP kinase [Anaerolineales bacterium]MCB9126307.1 dTMP kinase [Ardenticatenales bacterium]MCB9171308.1 dTMP kinase [Ardenticatenales bacterium]
MFITFEGPEGSGKTTQIVQLAQWLQQRGHRVVQTREPGGTLIGDQIRTILMDRANTSLVAEAEILLFSASRAQLVRRLIEPALAEGAVVLCDRFYDSTLAYQGYGRGLDIGMLREITDFATGGRRPDLTFLLDLDPELGLRRRQAGRSMGEEWNRLDAQTLAFHQRVRQGYLELAQQESRWRVVDGTEPSEAVQAALRQLIAKRLDTDS